MWSVVIPSDLFRDAERSSSGSVEVPLVEVCPVPSQRTAVLGAVRRPRLDRRAWTKRRAALRQIWQAVSDIESAEMTLLALVSASQRNRPREFLHALRRFESHLARALARGIKLRRRLFGCE